MGFAVRVRSAGQKYGPTCHQRNRADVTEFVTLVRLSSLGQHVGVLALAGYKHRKSALTAGPILLAEICHQPRAAQQLVGRHSGMVASAPPIYSLAICGSSPAFLAAAGTMRSRCCWTTDWGCCWCISGCLLINRITVIASSRWMTLDS